MTLAMIRQLARAGDTERAWALFAGAGLDAETGHGDTLALKGRLYKDRALKAAAKDRSTLLVAARQAYLKCRSQLKDDFDIVNGAFMDTATIMKNLDLVITSDTAVAHLAGALGVPVWLALPFVPDWRWLLDRSDSPWYPTMRLFRQESPGDWSGVFDEIKSALCELTPQSR